MARALDLAEQAIAINAYSDLPRALLAKINLTRHEYGKAVAEGNRAISLNPNGADSYAHFNSEEHIKAQAYKNRADEKRFCNALRDAGLP